MRSISTIFFLAIISISLSAQPDVLPPLVELDIPTDNPWSVIWHGDHFWISDAENGNIVRLHKYQEDLFILKAPRKHITGLTFQGDYLWALSDEWDTISLPHLSSINALMWKLDPETGEVLDSMLVPYHNFPTVVDKFLLGVSYYDSSFFVSYNGGWGSCMFRIEENNYRQELCCAHPAGMEVINGELWTVRFNDDNGTGNFMVPLLIQDSLSSEDWSRRMDINYYASDLAYDGKDIWLLDPKARKLKIWMNDSVPVDTIGPNCFNIEKLEIIPKNPAAGDEIKVVCHSIFSSGGCGMVDYDVSIGKTGIFVQANHEVGMLTYICESTDTIPIGKLGAGHHYVLEYNLTAINLNCGVEQGYIDFFVRDTTSFLPYIELIPEEPVAGETVKIVTHDICFLDAQFDLVSHHISLYAYWGSCIMTFAPCLTDTISLGFLGPDEYSLDFYLVDICITEPMDSIVYMENFDFEIKAQGATGTPEIMNEKFTLYPNPVTDKLNIYAENESTNLDISLFNIAGQVVLSQTFYNTGTIDLDLSDLRSGLYFVRIQSGDEVISKKIIKN